MNTQATVKLSGQPVGILQWDDNLGAAHFQYQPEFRQSGLELSPLHLPLRNPDVIHFKELSARTYKGLPGLFADSLPDRFGSMLLQEWRKRNNIDQRDFNPVMQLCYIGHRAMGALEYEPVLSKKTEIATTLHMDELVDITRNLLSEREGFLTSLSKDKQKALDDILRVGTSAGGARAKAVIAWNRKTGEIRSGQVKVPEGFEHYLLKFDGVQDAALGDPTGFGRLEYAYHLMAKDAGIDMMDCHLLEEGGRAHFLTERFDRNGPDKIHVQSLCAIAHYDFNLPGTASYEDSFAVTRKLAPAVKHQDQFFRRMVFNVLARNHDDHTRNVAYLMDDRGRWKLSPAYDMAWNYRPSSDWVSRHQMRINGKTDDFVRSDLIEAGYYADMSNSEDVIDQISSSVNRWNEFAEQAGVERTTRELVGKTHRKELMVRHAVSLNDKGVNKSPGTISRRKKLRTNR